MPLQEYIDKYYGGNKSAFARAMGVRRDVPARWIKEGWRAEGIFFMLRKERYLSQPEP
jgi:hypothetical protein